MEMGCSLASKWAKFGPTILSGAVTLKTVCNEMLILLVEIFVSHDVRRARVHSGTVRLKRDQTKKCYQKHGRNYRLVITFLYFSHLADHHLTGAGRSTQKTHKSENNNRTSPVSSLHIKYCFFKCIVDSSMLLLI